MLPWTSSLIIYRRGDDENDLNHSRSAQVVLEKWSYLQWLSAANESCQQRADAGKMLFLQPFADEMICNFYCFRLLSGQGIIKSFNACVMFHA